MEIDKAIEIINEEWEKSVRNSTYQNPKKLEREDALYMAITALKRQNQAEQAIEDMTFIIRQNGDNRCDYCILESEPCFVRDRHLNAECSFEYCSRELEG